MSNMNPIVLKAENIISHTIEELIEDNIYNLLVRKDSELVDIHCRIIGKKSTTILIFKLKDE